MSRTRRSPLYVVSKVWRALYEDYLEWELRRDGKSWHKAPSVYKRLKQAIRRAKDRDALRNGRIPEKWKRTNDWDWN